MNVDPLGQSEGVIQMEDWAEIRRLHRSEGMAIKAISRRLGLARNTVRAALAAEEPPRYERVAGGSRVDALEPAIRALLAEFPQMPATVILGHKRAAAHRSHNLDRTHLPPARRRQIALGRLTPIEYEIIMTRAAEQAA